MKISRKNSGMAKAVFKLVTENGKISESRLEKFLNILKSNRSKNNLEILLSLSKNLERFSREGKLVVESPFPLEKGQESKLKSLFEKKLGRTLDLETRVDRSLIGGIRIIIADNVWENSVVSSLQNLKGTV